MMNNPTKTPTKEDVRQLLEEGRQIRLAILREMKKLELKETPKLILK